MRWARGGRPAALPRSVVVGAGGYAEFPVADRRAELSKMTMAQLKPLCKGSGLKLGGKKADLVNRLLEHEFGTTDDEADIAPNEDIVGMAKEWRRGRQLNGGVSVGEMDAVLANAGYVDERMADYVYGAAAGYTDSSTSQFSTETGTSSEGLAARLVAGNTFFDDGGGSGWDQGAGADDWDRAEGYDDDYLPEPEPEPEPVDPAALKAAAAAERKARERRERQSLARRAAIVSALRQLAMEREGFEKDPRVHLEAVSRAIAKAYKKLRYSQYARMNPRDAEVCVDINVSEGTLAVLAQRIGRNGTVEWEVDDTDTFLGAYDKPHKIRKLAYIFTDELHEEVARAASDSYRRREGEMVEATVMTEGNRGEYLLRLDDGAFACLPPEEAIPAKRYINGDRLSAIVLAVDDRTWAADRRAPVVVSTSVPALLAEIIAAEVPEVASGDVVIKSVARVAGKMSKVAVARGEDAADVAWDPVLACVGPENSRLRAIRERLGGEVCQILTWMDNPEAMVAEALFPAQVQHVVRDNEEDGPERDERGRRRLAKFVAYVNQYDEAKAIGAGGVNVKLAAALCGCFILVERFEERSFSYGGGGGGAGPYNSRGGDTRGAAGGWEGDDAWFESDNGGFGASRGDDRRGRGIDISDNLDDLGWPDLEGDSVNERASEAQSQFGDLLGDGVDFASAAERAVEATAADEDDGSWEEVGPGKVGVVTFGASLGAGITGSASFMGDPEELPEDASAYSNEGVDDEGDDWEETPAGRGAFGGWDDDEDDAFGEDDEVFGDDFFGDDERR